MLGDLREVLEEHQGLAVRALVQGDEARLQFQPAAGDFHALGAQSRIALPQVQALDQGGGAVVDQLTFKRVLAQQGQGAVVGQLHVSLIVEYQNTGAHALQDQRIERLKLHDFTGALFGEGLAHLHTLHHRLHEQGGGKAQRAQCGGLQVIIGAGGMAEAQEEALPDNAECGDGGNQQAEAAPQQRVTDRHCDHQQIAEGAGDTAGGIEQAAQQQDIDQCQAEKLSRAADVLEEHHQQNVQHQVQPAAIAQQVVVRRGQQLIVQVAGNQQHQRDADA
ncbi:hypothetical protein D3C73_995940 [compost metagenome]